MSVLTPKNGQYVYTAWNGKLEKVTFLEQSLAGPECTIETWLCVDSDGRRFRCSTTMYLPSAKAAMQRHAEQVREALPRMRKAAEESARAVVDCEKEIARAEKAILSMT